MGKLARIVYRMLKYRKEFVDVGQEHYESQYPTRVITSMEQRAKEKGINMFLEVVAVGPDTKHIKVGMKVLSVKSPMQLPNVTSDDEEFKLGFLPEYTIEGYYED